MEDLGSVVELAVNQQQLSEDVPAGVTLSSGASDVDNITNDEQDIGNNEGDTQEKEEVTSAYLKPVKDTALLSAMLGDVVSRKRRLSVIVPSLVPSTSIYGVVRNASNEAAPARTNGEVASTLTATEQRLVKMYDSDMATGIEKSALGKLTTAPSLLSPKRGISAPHFSTGAEAVGVDKRGAVYKLLPLSPVGKAKGAQTAHDELPKLIRMQSKASSDPVGNGQSLPPFRVDDVSLHGIPDSDDEESRLHGGDNTGTAIRTTISVEHNISQRDVHAGQPAKKPTIAEDAYASRPLVVEVAYMARPLLDGGSGDGIQIDTTKKQQIVQEVLDFMKVSAQKRKLANKIRAVAQELEVAHHPPTHNDTVQPQATDRSITGTSVMKIKRNAPKSAPADASKLSFTAFQAFRTFRRLAGRTEDVDSEESGNDATDVSTLESSYEGKMETAAAASFLRKDRRRHSTIHDSLPIPEPAHVDLPGMNQLDRFPSPPGMPTLLAKAFALPDGYVLPRSVEALKEDAGRVLNFDVDEVFYDDVVLHRRYRVRNDEHLHVLVSRHAESLREGAIMHAKLVGLRRILAQEIPRWFDWLLVTRSPTATFDTAMLLSTLDEVQIMAHSNFIPEHIHESTVLHLGAPVLAIAVLCILHIKTPGSDIPFAFSILRACLMMFLAYARREGAVSELERLSFIFEADIPEEVYNIVRSSVAIDRGRQTESSGSESDSDSSTENAVDHSSPRSQKRTICLSLISVIAVVARGAGKLSFVPPSSKAKQTAATTSPALHYPKPILTKFKDLLCALSSHGLGRQYLSRGAQVECKDPDASCCYWMKMPTVDTPAQSALVALFDFPSLQQHYAGKFSLESPTRPQLAVALSCLPSVLNTYLQCSSLQDVERADSLRHLIAMISCIMLDNCAQLRKAIAEDAGCAPGNSWQAVMGKQTPAQTAAQQFYDVLLLTVRQLMPLSSDKVKLALSAFMAVAVHSHYNNTGDQFVFAFFMRTNLELMMLLVSSLTEWVAGRSTLGLSEDIRCFYGLEQSDGTVVEGASVCALPSTAAATPDYHVSTWQTSAAPVVAYCLWGAAKHLASSKDSISVEATSTLIGCALALLRMSDDRVKRCALSALTAILEIEVGAHLILHVPQLSAAPKAKKALTTPPPPPLYPVLLGLCMRNVQSITEELLGTSGATLSLSSTALLSAIACFLSRVTSACADGLSRMQLHKSEKALQAHGKMLSQTEPVLHIESRTVMYATSVRQLANSITWMLCASKRSRQDKIDWQLRAAGCRALAEYFRMYSEHQFCGSDSPPATIPNLSFLVALHRLAVFPDWRTAAQVAVCTWNLSKQQNNQNILLWAGFLPVWLKWSTAACFQHARAAGFQGDAVFPISDPKFNNRGKAPIDAFGTGFSVLLGDPLLAAFDELETTRTGNPATPAAAPLEPATGISTVDFHEYVLSNIQLLLSNENACYLFVNGGNFCPDLATTLMALSKRGRSSERVAIKPKFDESAVATIEDPVLQNPASLKYVERFCIGSKNLHKWLAVDECIPAASLKVGEGLAHLRDVCIVANRLAEFTESDASKPFSLSRILRSVMKCVWTAVHTDENIQRAITHGSAMTDATKVPTLHRNAAAVMCAHVGLFVPIFHIAASSAQCIHDGACVDALRLLHVFHSGAASKIPYSPTLRADSDVNQLRPVSRGGTQVAGTVDGTVADVFVRDVEKKFGACCYEQLLLGYMESMSADPEVDFLLHASATMAMSACRKSRSRFAEPALQTVARVLRILRNCESPGIAANLLYCLLSLSALQHCQLQIAQEGSDVLIDLCRLKSAGVPKLIASGGAALNRDAVDATAIAAAMVYRNISRNPANRTALYKAELAAHLSTFQQDVMAILSQHESFSRAHEGPSTGCNPSTPELPLLPTGRSTSVTSHTSHFDTRMLDTIINEGIGERILEDHPKTATVSRKIDQKYPNTRSSLMSAMPKTMSDIRSEAILTARYSAPSPGSKLRTSAARERPATATLVLPTSRANTTLRPSSSAKTRLTQGATSSSGVSQEIFRPSLQVRMSASLLKACDKMRDLTIEESIGVLRPYYPDLDDTPNDDHQSGQSRWSPAVRHVSLPADTRASKEPDKPRDDDLLDAAKGTPQGGGPAGMGRRASVQGFLGITATLGKIKILPNVQLDAKGLIPPTSTVLRTPRGTVLVVDDGAAAHRDAEGVLRPSTASMKGMIPQADASKLAGDLLDAGFGDEHSFDGSRPTSRNTIRARVEADACVPLYMNTMSTPVKKDAPVKIKLSSSSAKPTTFLFHAPHGSIHATELTHGSRQTVRNVLQLAPAPIAAGGPRLPDSLMTRTFDEDGEQSEVKPGDAAMQQLVAAAVARSSSATDVDADEAVTLSSTARTAEARYVPAPITQVKKVPSKRLIPIATLLAEAECRDVRASKFEHVDGSTVCGSMGHVDLPDGRSVHLYVQRDLFDADVPSRTKPPAPPVDILLFNTTGRLPAYSTASPPALFDFPVQTSVALNSMLAETTDDADGSVSDDAKLQYSFRIRFSCIPKPLVGTSDAAKGVVTSEVDWPSFAVRSSRSESKALTTSAKVLERCFRADWRRIADRDGFRVVMYWSSAAETLDTFQAAFKEHYAFLSELFSVIAAGNTSDPFVIDLERYHAFVVTSNFIEPGSKYCSKRALEAVFVQVNNEAEPGEDVAGNPLSALIRYEFLEAIARIACNKYLIPKRVKTMAEAVNTLVTDCIRGSSILSEWGSTLITCGDQYRNARVYEKDVNEVLSAHSDVLANVHKAYARHTVIIQSKAGPEKHTLASTDPIVLGNPLMSYEGWCTLMKAVKLIDDCFTESDAALCFSLSRMRVSNDVDLKRWTEATHLNIADFLEALCRVADMKSLPRDEDLSEFGGSLEAFIRSGKSWLRESARKEFAKNQTQAMAPRLRILLTILLTRLESYMTIK